MLKKLLTVLLIIIAFLSLFFLNSINHKHISIKYNLTITTQEIPIGKIMINKINLNEAFYNKESKKNNIEEHVTILKESSYPELLILAAHSGMGKIAYFERLNELNINDSITLEYKDKIHNYTITDIWEEKKNGKIHINKINDNQLVLTTCSPKHKDYQLIISCTEKEST